MSKRMTKAIAMDYFGELCANLAADADTAYRRNICQPHYLAGILGDDGIYREVCVVPQEMVLNSEASYILAQPVPRNLTVEQLTQWFRDQLRRIPCLPPEDVEP